MGPGWLKDHPAIDEVAHICQASTPVGTLLKESWEPIHVHFLVIARELGDTDPGEDEGNHVPELPLHAMHSRKSEISMNSSMGSEPLEVCEDGKGHSRHLLRPPHRENMPDCRKIPKPQYTMDFTHANGASI